MAKNLVIVESPAKARTVGRFLGKDYRAEASMGHVRDLPQRELGVEITNGRFKPVYKVLPDKRKIVSEAGPGREGGLDDIPRHRPGPRRRGHIVAPSGGVQHRPFQDQACRVP